MSTAPEQLGDHLTLLPWHDPRLDRSGHDPRSDYVELYWLPVVGPSTLLLIRRAAMALEQSPDGVVIDLEELSRSLGLGRHGSKNSSLTRTIRRSCQFGLARSADDQTLLVRRRLPRLAHHHVARLPPNLRDRHDALTDTRSIVPIEDAHRA